MNPKLASVVAPPLLRSTLLVCASLCAVAEIHAASDTWLAAPTSANWVDGPNWVSGTPPGAITGTTNPDTATFGTSTGLAVTVDANRNLQNITFSANLTYTLSGEALLLTSGGTILSNGSAGDERITSALQIQDDGGTYKIQTDTPGTNRELIISAGGITGVATGTNNTALTLTGASGGANAISAAIGNGSGGGTLSLVKEGGGLWILSSGANTYSGGTTVTAGTLRSDNSGLSSLALGTGPVTINGGTLRFQSSSGTAVDNAIVSTANGGFISFRGNSTFNPASITGTGTLNLSADTGVTVTTANFQNFAGTLNLGSGAGNNFFRLGSGYNENSLGSAAVHLAASAIVSHQSGTNSTFNTLIGTLSGAAGSSIGGSAAGGGTIFISTGARNEDSIFAGTIVDGGTKTGLIKNGTGKLTLQGLNTYTGPTTVNDGILSLTNASLADASTVSIAAGKVIDLNFAGSDTIGTLILGGVTVPGGTYNSAHVTYGAYFTGTGSLSVGAVAYGAWASSYGLQNPWLGIDPALNGSPTTDPDSDGQANSLEFALGGSPVSGSNNAKIHSFVADSDLDADTLPELLMTIAVRTGTPAFSNTASPAATFDGFTTAVQGSTTLGTFTTAVSPVPTPVTTDLLAAPAGYEYRTFSLTGSNGAAGRGFLRVSVN